MKHIPKNTKILVGLSGGVDSAVTALLLKEAGYDLVGVRMKIYRGPAHPGVLSGCYGRAATDDLAAARGLADGLGIPFYELDCSEAWQELVLADFRAEYLAGRTPNPCVRCNELVKFGVLRQMAQAQGLACDYFATGHYAQIEIDESGNPHLRRGGDPHKDQSYFLYRLPKNVLAKTIFPLGGFSKAKVRELALERGLAVHDRPDSQDFYDGDYTNLLNAPPKEGDIINTSGNVVGRHKGFWHYTPGQRRGLGVCGPEPLYVLRVDAARNEVIVGPAVENIFAGALVGELNFIEPEPEAGTNLQAKVRSAQKLKDVTVMGRDHAGLLQIAFNEPLSALAPGQSLVLYRGDLVVGGGIISAPFKFND